jgi:hypothetical protein
MGGYNVLGIWLGQEKTRRLRILKNNGKIE